jgi:hypothetical protein
MSLVKGTQLEAAEMTRKLPNAVHCCSYAYTIKEMVAASFLSCIIGAGFCAVTGSSVAKNVMAITNSVARTTKGDRLPQAPKSDVQRLPIHRLIGCEPASSPIVDPVHAHIFGRCLT